MGIKTVRFNHNEEMKLKKLLSYYDKDFSSCVKELISEKLEDLVDIGCIKKIREGKQEDYYTAHEIEAEYKKKKS